MKNNFIIILAFVFYNCNSQCGFYIKPFITPLKYEITNNLSGEFKSVSGETIFIKADNLFTPRAGIYFGAEFGYRIKNFFGEVGLNQDGALSKFIISGKSYDWDNNSDRQVWEHYSGAALINYHLRLGLKIRELNIEYYKNTSASLFLIGGIEMLKNYGKPNNNFKELNQSSVVFMPNDSSTIEVTSKTIQTFVNYNIQPSIGLFLEIKFKKISILNLSLIPHATMPCELSVSGRRAKRKGGPTMSGSRRTSMATNEIHVTDKPGESNTDLAKVRAGTPYVWDGKNDDDRPLTRDEMQAGIEAYRKQLWPRYRERQRVDHYPFRPRRTRRFPCRGPWLADPHECGAT